MTSHSGNYVNQKIKTNSNTNQIKSYESVIGANLVINGNIQSSGTVRIDGTVNNDVTVSGNLFIAETGHITGTVLASDIEIAGVIEGDVKGNTVRILKTGKVIGDIYSTELITESGARIQGHIVMNDTTDHTLKSRQTSVSDENGTVYHAPINVDNMPLASPVSQHDPVVPVVPVVPIVPILPVASGSPVSTISNAVRAKDKKK